MPNNKILQIVVNEIIGAVGNMPKISLLLGDCHCILFPESQSYQDTDRHFNKKKYISDQFKMSNELFEVFLGC